MNTDTTSRLQAHNIRHGMIIATPKGASAVRDIDHATIYPPGMRAVNQITLTTANGESQTFEYFEAVEMGR